MDISGEYTIPASREVVWRALNDPETLQACIPGCEELIKVSDTEFAAKVTSKIGPVSARFSGTVKLSDLDPPHSYTIAGEGQGGAAGFAKGSAHVVLEPQGDGTLLRYTAQATVGGKLAAVGSRLVQSAAKKTADDFFSAFADRLGGEAAVPEAERAAPPAPQRPAIPAWAWAAGAAAVIAILLILWAAS